MKLTHPATSLKVEVSEDTADVYRSQGWRAEGEGVPKGNASLEEWQKYARAQGKSAEDIEGKTRDELRALFA